MWARARAATPSPSAATRRHLRRAPSRSVADRSGRCQRRLAALVGAGDRHCHRMLSRGDIATNYPKDQVGDLVEALSTAP
jgi:hypothetical protein